MTALLQTTDLTVRFGGLVAVDHLSLEIHAGELVGLIGPNGSGKTTFINAVTGFVPSTGTVTFDGDDVTGWAPHRIANRGLTRTWQTLELFDDLSIRVNLEVAAEQLTFLGAVRDYYGRGSEADERVDEALAVLNLTDIQHRMPSDLSQGNRKLVGVARALVGDVKLVLLDEPAAGLDREETTWLGGQLRDVVESGISGMLIDHDMGLVLSVCDRIYVINYGGLIAVGTPEEIRAHPEVRKAYLGVSGGGEG